MQDDPRYDDVVAEVRDFLVARAEAADARRRRGGLDRPGHRLRQDGRPQPLAAAPPATLVATGYPVLVGASRKSFLGKLTGGAPVDDRLEASLAAAAWAMSQGAAMVRVHDVPPTVQAVRLVGARAS